MKKDPYHQKSAKCRPVILVSRNMCEYSQGFPRQERRLTVGFSKTDMLRPFLRNFRLLSAHIIIQYAGPRRLFRDPKMCDPEMTSKRNSRYFVPHLVPDASTSTKLLCSAYTNVPILTYSKIRYIGLYINLQWHRAVLLAIARLCCQ